MADSASESDSSSVDGLMVAPSPMTREQFQKRIDSLYQENRVLKIELETYRLRVKQLQEENTELRRASVNIQAKAEQEEEYISNTLLKKIQALKREKETLCQNYEQEEECLTNDLSRKLTQLRQEKVQLEQSLEHEQEALVNKLMRKIERLEADTLTKQNNLEQLRREKVELESTLEQEQEALVNRLWKRMDTLEAEKRSLQEKLDQPISAPPSPRSDVAPPRPPNPDPAGMTRNIRNLKQEVNRLKTLLHKTGRENAEKIAQLSQEEKQIKEENFRLQRKLQMEVERREQLCRHLSESESSLEMDEERIFNEGHCVARSRAVSSPIPYAGPGQRSISPAPGGVSSSSFRPGSPMGSFHGRCCPTCQQPVLFPMTTAPVSALSHVGHREANPQQVSSMLPPNHPATGSAAVSGSAWQSRIPAATSTSPVNLMGPPASPMDTSRPGY
ncbi:coiled-coil domain-containing protein 6 [Galendromus occidentalis]|uniref:Coiled-coil domain-containing protein 6 n=1 Tax=Galendromus occidentalis TaxID=34638 RepID=A0AAJ6QRJ8_9ACAR|nr:coiled-coil domain-containing protein 6 [Galendromus occidentalis]